MKSLSCVQLCDPVDCSLPGSSVRGISQARVLEWVSISFSRGSSQPRDRNWVSHIAGRCFAVWATRLVLSLDFYILFNYIPVYAAIPCFNGSEVKASAYNVRDLGLIPGLGRSLGEGNGNPFQYSCLENPMDRGAWWVHGVAKSWAQLSDFTFTFTMF